jgi:predicted DNA-binding transcriptional regulator YafY
VRIVKRRERGGAIRVAFKVWSLVDVQQYVLSLGGRVQAIEPEELRWEVAAEASELARLHGG